MVPKHDLEHLLYLYLKTMQQEIKQAILVAINKLYGLTIEPEVFRPEENFGDYSTNVALVLSRQLSVSPRQIAEVLSAELTEQLKTLVQTITIAGPGFINIKILDQALIKSWQLQPKQIYSKKTIIAEYSDPNPFKALHAGHLYTTIIGNSIANLFEIAGGKVHRVNFGSDVGLPVSKTMWGILNSSSSPKATDAEVLERIKQLDNSSLEEKANFMALCYRQGNQAYEEDDQAKLQIIDINKQIYNLHLTQDHQSDFAIIYWTCRQWSYDYFIKFYQDIGVHPFEKFYPESETAALGLKIVREQQQKGIYTDSKGAVIFNGEPFGLHARVFINSHGLPTYEAKDVGLIFKKWDDYKFDLSVVITGNDIIEYMKVVLKSIEQFRPELAKRTKHITHGQVKLTGGKKMSSRTGTGLLATDVLEAAFEAANKNQSNNQQIAYAAVKYSFLKQRIGGDIIYSPEESVSIEGNSGPYLQYAHARASSVIKKSKIDKALLKNMDNLESITIEADERTLVRKLSEYVEVIDQAVDELMPHLICTYLYELAQTYNRFYEKNRIIGDNRQQFRLLLTQRYVDTLAQGLSLLGMNAPEQM